MMKLMLKVIGALLMLVLLAVLILLVTAWL